MAFNAASSRAFRTGSLTFLSWSCRFFNPLDRKSTRLNSSHLVISYAVFCLKKKNAYNLIFEERLQLDPVVGRSGADERELDASAEEPVEHLAADGDIDIDDNGADTCSTVPP